MKTSISLTKTNKVVKTILVGLILIILASGLPAGTIVASAASNATCAQKYTVQSGDTLSKIAAQYKIDWLDLAKSNNLDSPYTIYIGQTLCIPSSGTDSGVKNTSSTPAVKNKAKAAIFTATRIERNKLIIETENFPKNSFYYVKIRSGSGALSEHWTKIGMLRTKKDSSASYMFNLPNDFRKHSAVKVCLKNAVTDVVICRRAIR